MMKELLSIQSSFDDRHYFQSSDLKSIFMTDQSDFSFETGDSLRVSAYRDGYYAWPEIFIISGSSTLNFLFQIGSVTTGTLIDSRDDKVYKTVKIGDQWWMAENLAWLPSVSPSSEGSTADPYYYVYDYQGTDVTEARATGNFQTYGVLYNWPSAMDACPAGWHLPSDEEWTTLVNYLIANGYNYDGTTTDNKIAKSLASATLWGSSTETGAVGNTDYPEKQNTTGFSALPGGERSLYRIFDYIGYLGVWWSATEGGALYAWGWYMDYIGSYLAWQNYGKEIGYSVRCLKD